MISRCQKIKIGNFISFFSSRCFLGNQICHCPSILLQEIQKKSIQHLHLKDLIFNHKCIVYHFLIGNLVESDNWIFPKCELNTWFKNRLSSTLNIWIYLGTDNSWEGVSLVGIDLRAR